MARKRTPTRTVPAVAAPAHHGDAIPHRLDAAGCTLPEAAIELGISKRRLQAVLDGKAAITPDIADRLSYTLGGDPETWLALDAPPPAPAPPFAWSSWKLHVVLIAIAAPFPWRGPIVVFAALAVTKTSCQGG